ncbi:MAG TPA: hypothetical protein PKD00_01460 [Burkholderiales bacterium]|nr:hypothetical protein [Burkholderiales bacterium]
MNIDILNNILITNKIDYPSLLMIYDLYYNTNTFKEYYLTIKTINDRRNVELGSLVNIKILIKNGYLKNNIENLMSFLDKETIDVIYKRLILTAKAKALLKSNDIFSYEKKEEPVENWIDEYRKIWSENGRMLKPDAMGSKQICISKMSEFVKNNPKYSKETIIKAAKYYVNMFKQNNSVYTYLITAPYFIHREKSPDGKAYEKASMKLIDYCDIVLSNKEEKILEQKSDLA